MVDYEVGMKLTRIDGSTVRFRKLIGEIRTIIRIDASGIHLDSGFSRERAYYDRFFEPSSHIFIGGE